MAETTRKGDIRNAVELLASIEGFDGDNLAEFVQWLDEGREIATHVAENPFQADCRKVEDHLGYRGGWLPHSALLSAMEMTARDFKELIETLVQRGEITRMTSSEEGIFYRLTVDLSGILKQHETAGA